MSAKEYALSQLDVTSSPELPPTSDNIDGGMEQLKVVPQRDALSVGEKPSSMRRRVTEERVNFAQDVKLSLIHISEPTRLRRSRMPSSA